MNGVPYAVVGVMPPGFVYPHSQTIWLPIQLDATKLERGAGPWLELTARLKPGVSLDAANADVGGIAKRIAAEQGLPGYRVAMSVNREGGQVVFHAHLHVLGGRALKGALG